VQRSFQVGAWKVLLASDARQSENFLFRPTAGWTCYRAGYRLFAQYGQGARVGRCFLRVGIVEWSL
jgi:hypothetical protein